MKSKIIYTCEICGTESDNRSRVEHCEARGKPDRALAPPRGLIVGEWCGPGKTTSLCVNNAPWTANKGQPCNSTHCRAGFIWVVQFTGLEEDPHEFRVGFGVFRRERGDTYTFDNPRGGYDPFKMGERKYEPEKGFQRWQDWPEAHECDAFWRAVAAVRAAGWTPRVVRDQKLVEVTAALPEGFDPNPPLRQ